MIDLRKEVEDKVICKILNKISDEVQNIKRIASKLDDLDKDKVEESLKEIVFYAEVLRGYKR